MAARVAGIAVCADAVMKFEWDRPRDIFQSYNACEPEEASYSVYVIIRFFLIIFNIYYIILILILKIKIFTLSLDLYLNVRLIQF